MPSLPTGTVTFLFTDIEGSTELLQHLGDRRYAEITEEHHRLLHAAFEEGNGQDVDTQGDAFQHLSLVEGGLNQRRSGAGRLRWRQAIEYALNETEQPPRNSAPIG